MLRGHLAELHTKVTSLDKGGSTPLSLLSPVSFQLVEKAMARVGGKANLIF